MQLQDFNLMNKKINVAIGLREKKNILKKS